MIWKMESCVQVSEDGRSKYPVRLCESSEKGKYIVTQPGWLAPVLSCGNFVLISDAVYRFLSQHITPGVFYEPAWIENRANQTRTTGYWRFTCDHGFTIPDSAFFDTLGIAVWLANDEYIFISDELKQQFENTPVKGMVLLPGFGSFVN